MSFARVGKRAGEPPLEEAKMMTCDRSSRRQPFNGDSANVESQEVEGQLGLTGFGLMKPRARLASLACAGMCWLRISLKSFKGTSSE